MTELTSADLLPIGQIAQRAGVAVSAVRYYESLGLLPSVREPGRRRMFGRHVLRRIAVIQASVRFGLTLAEVREMFLMLPNDRPPGDAEWRQVTQRWSAHLAQQQQTLARMQEQIAGCIGCGCLSQSICAVVNSEDTLAAAGPGAQRIADN